MTAAFEPHWVQRPATPVDRVWRPTDLRRALELVAEDPARRPVAGGTDLVVDLDRASGDAVELVDLTHVLGLNELRLADGVVHLGAGVTHNQLLGDTEIVGAVRPLAQACLEIGSPQLRNRATIAGNVVTASPANDSISALMALDAVVELGRFVDDTIETRAVPIRVLFTGVRSTVIEPGELVTAIRVPVVGPSASGVWVKLGLRRAQAISVVHAGVWVEFESGDPSGPVIDARIALGSVAPTVVLSTGAREALVGRPLTTDSIEAAAVASAEGVDPIDDGRATAGYRRSGVETVVRRALHAIAGGDTEVRWPARVPRLATSPPTTSAGAVNESISDATEIRVTVNGRSVAGTGAASSTLLDWVRDHVGTGTKEGCAEGECGACTVMLDGDAVMACLTPAAQAEGHAVTTVEGIGDGDRLSRVQQAFVDDFAVQCGYCIPGFIVAATALDAELGDATRDEVEFGLAGNLCRCTGYYAILEAVRDAADGAAR